MKRWTIEEEYKVIQDVLKGVHYQKIANGIGRSNSALLSRIVYKIAPRASAENKTILIEYAKRVPDHVFDFSKFEFFRNRFRYNKN